MEKEKIETPLQSVVRKAMHMIEDKSNNKEKLHLALGSGRTVAFFWTTFIQHLSTSMIPKTLLVYTTSEQSRRLVINSVQELCAKNSALQIIISDFDCISRLDDEIILVDGYDRIVSFVNKVSIAVKGGGGAHFREKLAYKHSTTKILIGWGSEKIISDLNPTTLLTIPLEVVPIAVEYVKRVIYAWKDEMIRQVIVRECEKGKVGPIITDNGNILLDVLIMGFETDRDRLLVLGTRLKLILGVLETGIFELDTETTIIND